MAGSFRDVLDAFRICPTLPLARSAFLALPKDQRNEIKMVPFFVPSTFHQSPSPRDMVSASLCNLLFVDIDTTKDGQSPAAPFVGNPDSLYQALADFNFIAHTTASSTEALPRMRIVIDADSIPLEQYPEAIRTVAGLLGLPSLTAESKKAVQPMFLPTLFSDSTEEDHPLIAHRLDGRAFGVEDISATEANEHFSRNGNGSNGHSLTTPADPFAVPLSPDPLNFLRAPVPEITLSVAREALFSIEPDCSYFDWLECAAALRHQFSPRLAEEAYDLFDEWSQGGSKYASSTDTRAKWDSLRPTPVGRTPITIRSLLRQAVSAGWSDIRVKENCFQKLLEWMDTRETATELMEKGVQRILATPLLSAMQEGMLVDHLRGQLRKQFAITLLATEIRKDLVRVKAEIKTQETSQEKKGCPKWALDVCYISAPQDFYCHRTGEKYKAASFDAINGRFLLPTPEQLKGMGMAVTPENLASPTIDPSDYALNHLKITTAYDYAYDPSQPTTMFFVQDKRRYVNTYSPSYPEPDHKLSEYAGNLFGAHLRTLIAEPGYCKTLTDFMAFIVQYPGRKIRWAVFIQSVEGAGKTFLAKAMKAVLGPQHVRTIDCSTIKKGWNEWAFGAQLIVLEEVRVSGANRHEIMNTLKPLISDDDNTINERNRNTRSTLNISNYMLFSNHHDALALTPGDRRYFVLKSPLQAKADVLALGGDYFLPLFALLRDHPGALRAYLNDWKISPDFNADGHAPVTTYLRDMVNDSASDLAAAVRRLLLEGDHPLAQYDIVSGKALQDLLFSEESLNRISAQQLGAVLREEGFCQVGRHMINGERHYLWTRGQITDAVELAIDRLKKNQKNLHMELLFT